jgi:phosphoribosyl-ATP pyrophosphohydrolase
MTDILTHLEDIIHQRRSANPDESYIAKRLKQGTEKVTQKLGEEAVETVIAAMKKDKAEIISESADLLFHWLLVIADGGVRVAEVMDELKKREGTSGLDEKARRKIKGEG